LIPFSLQKAFKSFVADSFRLKKVIQFGRSFPIPEKFPFFIAQLLQLKLYINRICNLRHQPNCAGWLALGVGKE